MLSIPMSLTSDEATDYQPLRDLSSRYGESVDVRARDLTPEMVEAIAAAARKAGDTGIARVAEAIAAARDGDTNRPIPRLSAFPDMLVSYLREHLRDGWLYRKGSDGHLHPWLVTDVIYHEASQQRERPSVSVYLAASGDMSGRGKTLGATTTSMHFSGQDVSRKRVADVLTNAGCYVETEALRADYDEALADYRDVLADGFAEQYHFSGQPISEPDSYSWRTPVARHGIKVIHDLHRDEVTAPGDWADSILFGEADDSEQDADKPAPKKARKHGEEMGVGPVPIHFGLRVFDLGKHEFLWVNARDVERYVYDPTLADKIVLPADQRNLLDILTTNLDDFTGDVIEGKSAGNVVLCKGEPGVGKGHPLDTQVLTESGWRRIGDLSIGDAVIGSDGTPTAVTGVFDRGELPVYRVTLDDGASVLVDADHLWQVSSLKQRPKGTSSVVETRDLLGRTHTKSGRARWSIPLVKPVRHAARRYPIEPYTLGVLLANGHLSGSVTISTNDESVIERVMSEVGGTNAIRETTPNPTRRWIVAGISDALRRCGLLDVRSADKFIPLDYLTGHVDQRRALLHGLMDCDGSVRSGRSQAQYHTRSRLLAEDVRALVESLGGVTRMQQLARVRDDGVEYDMWRVDISIAECPFKMSRKAEGWAPTSQLGRRIVAVTPEGSAQVRCIRVAAEDSLYVTERYIVTHNTLTAEIYSELIERPLYSIHSGNLGTSAESVRKALEIVFERALRWNAVLLLDEADVFVLERGSNITQNAIVAEFLRTLEYFTGLMFMTTNRADNIDDAILSRAAAIIDYALPDVEGIRAVWQVQATNQGVVLPDDLLDDLVHGFVIIAPRDVKMLLRLALRVAKGNGIDLDVDTFARCAMFRGLHFEKGSRA